MRRTTFAIGVAAAILLSVTHDSSAQRGSWRRRWSRRRRRGRWCPSRRRWGSGARGCRGWALRRKCGWGRSSGTVVGPAGGAGSGTRSSGSVAGPAGGTRSAGGGVGRTRPSAVPRSTTPAPAAAAPPPAA